MRCCIFNRRTKSWRLDQAHSSNRDSPRICSVFLFLAYRTPPWKHLFDTTHNLIGTTSPDVTIFAILTVFAIFSFWTYWAPSLCRGNYGAKSLACCLCNCFVASFALLRILLRQPCPRRCSIMEFDGGVGTPLCMLDRRFCFVPLLVPLSISNK
jgi:hypothetical protein